jgi:hypothetical protein
MHQDLEQLASIVDQPDFEDAMARDENEAFRKAVDDYLEQWGIQLRQSMAKGLTPDSYEEIKLFSDSLGTAVKVVEFMSVVKKLEKTQDSHQAN